MLIVTQAFFIPELMAFEASPGSGLAPAEWFARGKRWQRLSWIRGATMYAGILPLLFAVTKPVTTAKGYAAAGAES